LPLLLLSIGSPTIRPAAPFLLAWHWQADVSSLLLEKLPMLVEEGGEEAAIPQLILGQFRW